MLVDHPPFTLDTLRQAQFENFVLVSALTALVWDILINIHNEYRLVFECDIKLGTVIYFASRAISLTFVSGTVIYQMTQIGHCHAKGLVIDMIYACAISTSCLLFLLRLHAIFIGSHWHKHVVWISIVLWLGVLGASLFLNVDGSITLPDNPTRTACFPQSFNKSIQAAPIALLVYDTFVFISTSWQLLRFAPRPCGIRHARAFIFSDFRTALPKLMLRDGQLYYLIAFSGNLLTVVFIDTSFGLYRAVFVLPNLVLTHVIACYTFRNTKLALLPMPEY